ncbi:GreA/GreB family elongation factor [Psychromonas ingrahamii 37]|uniref:GreA/GreB family elongation factor n=1 Tax=Psychromonas ingrahamii (strain DSM 17664 / CCUG 51855 / 37) TaxID=357804 RepID=A1SXZ5_PSYIN|nr:transcription elongation factor [Psychromonas ingrahamii]ABM04360.1 GreA/GreB family elongation factor [Psychromonas ingrahamii 37]
MNKKQVHNQLILALEATYQGAVKAAERAYNTATNNENVAENKYDTLALEASYLAQGQAQRVAECAQDLIAFQQLNISAASLKLSVCLGALVLLHDLDDNEKYVFYGPSAGGLKVQFAEKDIVVVTPGSPLGAAIKDRSVGDEISLFIGNKVIEYEIAEIY